MKYTLTVGMLLMAAVLGVTPAARASTEWHVNGDSGRDSNNCLSATTPCKTIGHAISLASSGDSIMVAAATYTENLTIAISVKVIGSGAATTIIDGGGSNTVVTVSNASSHVTLSKITIRNGSAAVGGGVNNSGELTVSHSILAGNTAQGSNFNEGAGIYNSGTLNVTNSTLTRNIVLPCGIRSYCQGGGIANLGTLTINNSTVTGNSAAKGGSAISNLGSGANTINNSTISGNGHIAILNYADTLTINNSTISGNADEATYIFNGTLTINNSTISENGSGIASAFNGMVTIQNSIVANNSGGNCQGNTVTSKGYNLSSDGTCNFTGPGDLNNNAAKLGLLGNYGGPTQTIPLLSGSPAIDAGNPNGCTDGNGNLLKTDQRGMPRPDREDTGGCDMGAYERQSD